MVIQPRGKRLRLFRQHDHALACGKMALSWSRGELSWDALVAIGIHDCGWIATDQAPRIDPSTGTPFDFIHTPLEERVHIYRRSIDEAERVSAHAGLLVHTHFVSFLSENVAPEFCASERTRRKRLEDEIGLTRVAKVAREYAALQALDLLSLAACMTTPGSDPESHPRWLSGTIVLAGVHTTLRWEDQQTLRIKPSLFQAPVQIELTHVEIDRRYYTSDDEARTAFEEGTRGTTQVLFC